MNNLQRVAIVLLAMGRDQASQVLQHMDSNDVTKLASAMDSVASMSEQQINDVLVEFMEISKDQFGQSMVTNELVHETLADALGNEHANSLMDKICTDRDCSGLNVLSGQEPQQLIEFIVDEHPQVIAIVVTYLESEQAATLLSLLDEAVRIDVIKRVASLGAISPLALQLLNEAMDEQIQEIDQFKGLPLGGAQTAASIMNYLDSETESKVIKALESADKDLGVQVQEMIFPFERLYTLDDASLQKLLNNVANDVLINALKAAEQDFIIHCVRCVSLTRAELIKTSLNSCSPVKLNEALRAQKSIVTIAQKLAKKNVLSLTGQSELTEVC